MSKKNISLELKHLDSLFREGIRDPKNFKLGTEVELLPVCNTTFRALTYGSVPGVQSILEYLGKSSWEPLFENQAIVGLKRDFEFVSIEPSGAIEYDSPPLNSSIDIKSKIEHFIEELRLTVADQGVNFLLCGMSPFESVEDLPLVPKSRYEIMYDYMPQVGSLGREMMKLTGAVQVAIDYSSEADAMQKLFLACKLAPYLLALSANSPIRHGKFSGYASYRGWIWQNTDPIRSHLPEFAFRKDSSFKDYVDWALDVPMYFIERDGIKYTLGHPTFRQFLEGKYKSDDQEKRLSPTYEDWLLHLSTLFPETRFRNYLELRSMDMNPIPVQTALLAFIENLFYDPTAFRQAIDLVSSQDYQQTLELTVEACKKGLDAKLNGAPLRETCKTLLHLAQEACNRRPLNNCVLLDPLFEKLETWSLNTLIKSINKNPKDHLKKQLLF